MESQGTRQASEVGSGLGPSHLYDVDRCASEMAQLAERWENRLTWETLDLRKEYIRGNLCIILKLKARAEWYPRERSVATCASADQNAVLESHVRSATWIQDYKFGYACNSYNRLYDTVLINVVEKSKMIKGSPFASRIDLKTCEHGFNILAGCLYSFTEGFKTRFVFSCGEFESPILLASISGHDSPSRMIEAGAEVVDSIAYYQTEANGILAKIDTDQWLPCFRVMLNDKGVWVPSLKGLELPFEVCDVMIGPFDL